MYTAIIENITHASATVANLFTNFTPKNTIRPRTRFGLVKIKTQKSTLTYP